MNIKRLFVCMLIAGAAAVPAVVRAASTEDARITTQVYALIEKERDIPHDVLKIVTTDKVVKISGQLETTLQANRAIELAHSVNNVQDVDSSELETKSSSQFMQDAVITAKAKGKVLQLVSSGKITFGNDLHFETTDGNLHVIGSVAKKKDVEIIRNALKSISSVKQVKTNIRVSS